MHRSLEPSYNLFISRTGTTGMYVYVFDLETWGQREIEWGGGNKTNENAARFFRATSLASRPRWAGWPVPHSIRPRGGPGRSPPFVSAGSRGCASHPPEGWKFAGVSLPANRQPSTSFPSPPVARRSFRETTTPLPTGVSLPRTKSRGTRRPSPGPGVTYHPTLRRWTRTKDDARRLAVFFRPHNTGLYTLQLWREGGELWG